MKRKSKKIPDSEQDDTLPDLTSEYSSRLIAKLREENARHWKIVQTLRHALIAEGARANSSNLNARIYDFLQQISISHDVTQWKIEARNNNRLGELINSIDETRALLDYQPNAYLIMQVNPEHQILQDVASILHEIRGRAVRAHKNSSARPHKPALEKMPGAVMRDLDDFFQELTGKRLNQKKWILVNTARGTDGGKVGTRARSFPYAVLNGIAPHIPNGQIVTALKHYISKRNAEQQIPSHGRRLGAKNKRKQTQCV